MDDASHQDIIKEIAKLTERVSHLSDEMEDGFDRAERVAAKASENRKIIFAKLRALETARKIEEGVDKKTRERADKFRAGLYEFVRMFLPPGVIGLVIMWWVERSNQ